MTFRSSARSNVNRYIQAGNAAASAGVEISGGIAANRPRYDKIEDARQQVHALLFDAAVSADAGVAMAGMQIKAAREQRKAKEQAKKKIRASNKSAAMAGKLAAGAQAIGLSQYVRNQKQEVNPLIDLYQQQLNKTGSKLEDVMAKLDELNSPKPTAGNKNTPSDTPGSGSIISSGQALEAGIGTPGKGGKYSQTEMAGFAEQAGFSPEQAQIMGAIGMGESGGNAGVDTVQSGLDPNRTNEFSVGLFQINAQAHGDKLAKLGYTVDDLRDPVKNAQVAKMVYDEVGGFTPWSVYNKGIYTRYLD